MGQGGQRNKLHRKYFDKLMKGQGADRLAIESL